MERQHPSWTDLLRQAVTEPGELSRAYETFHGYSLGNILMAWGQAVERKIPLGPIATYAKWQALGRQVRRGEKAIWLCQPVSLKKRIEEKDEEEEIITRFVCKPHWFFVSQTDGAEIAATAVPGWDRTCALANLGIIEEPFTLLDGNCQGYARQRTIAINPVAALPLKTFAHECAHVILGHTTEVEQTDSDLTPRTLREVEAEATAMLVCAALGLPGVELSRGYIQHWNGSGNEIPEKSCQRIFKAADTILKAGRATEAEAQS